MSSKRGVRRKQAAIDLNRRHESCEKKIAHPTEDAAKAAQRGMWKQARMRTYKCEYANHWHVGHGRVAQ